MSGERFQLARELGATTARSVRLSPTLRASSLSAAMRADIDEHEVVRPSLSRPRCRPVTRWWRHRRSDTSLAAEVTLLAIIGTTRYLLADCSLAASSTTSFSDHSFRIEREPDVEQPPRCSAAPPAVAGRAASVRGSAHPPSEVDSSVRPTTTAPSSTGRPATRPAACIAVRMVRRPRSRPVPCPCAPA